MLHSDLTGSEHTEKRRKYESDRQLSTAFTGMHVGSTGDEVRRQETAGAELEAERSEEPW